MIEDKGTMATYDDTCSRSSNEEDSLLSAGSSPNMTSPSSTSALSGAGSSADEGVYMGSAENPDPCKRMLFTMKDDFKRRMPDVQDQPIDLSMKKKRSNEKSISSRENTYNKLATHASYGSSCRENSDLVIDEQVSPKPVPKMPSISDGLGSKGNSPTHSPPMGEISSSLAPTYLPWSYGPRPGGVPFPTSTMHSLWHPALLMSQAARHLTPSMAGLGPYSLSPNASTVSRFTTSADALHQLYGQNVLAEFSRICSQAKHLYGGHVLPEHYGTIGGRKESPKAAKSTTEHRESPHEKFARENGVRIKEERAPSPDSTSFRKRKHEEMMSESNFRLLAEEYGNAPLGKRIREDRMLDCVDSPPTMIPNLYASQSSLDMHQPESGRLIPKPVDFKPCRFPCNECGRTYATVGGLLKHSKSHHDPENNSNFKCKTCDKEYNSLGALKMHIRTHTLPCKCHICGKAFSRTWLLQGHIRTHTGEKPYQCNVCSRAFADRSNLRAHMQTHESVKRYGCTSCDKTFSRISLLNRHRVSGCVSNTLQPSHASLQAVSN